MVAILFIVEFVIQTIHLVQNEIRDVTLIQGFQIVKVEKNHLRGEVHDIFIELESILKH
jgi:hypothetical protein